MAENILDWNPRDLLMPEGTCFSSQEEATAFVRKRAAQYIGSLDYDATIHGVTSQNRTLQFACQVLDSWIEGNSYQRETDKFKRYDSDVAAANG